MMFNSIKVRKPSKSKFNLSHEVKMSLKMNRLYPVLVREVNPGDSFRVNSEVFIRMAPMVAPMMHRVNIKTEYFFVPNRLVWDEWEKFITGGEQGTAKPVFPQMVITDSNKARFQSKRLPDYMGVPITDGKTLNGSVFISALPFRAYQMIYNEYYRDQNLSNEVPFSIGSGQVSANDLQELCTIRKRAWQKDYFTSALPWPQRGGEAQLPLSNVSPNYKDVSEYYDFPSGNPAENTQPQLVIDQTLNAGVLLGQEKTRVENIEDFEVDPVSINDLRKATRLQEWLEKSARGGARYIEQILSHFGVRSSDARLQRPEYLGGSSQPMKISEVLNTASDTATDPTTLLPLGEMGGHGVGYGGTNGFSKSFEEHGYIIGLLSVLPTPAYQQGLPRHYARADKFDYYWPEFAQLGEQEVYNQELFLDYEDVNTRKETFGYQQRYAEYKYMPSTVHGEFRTNLNFWHMGRIFEDLPVLNENFVAAEDINRIFAVTDEETDNLYAQIYHNISALMPMPYHAIPTL